MFSSKFCQIDFAIDFKCYFLLVLTNQIRKIKPPSIKLLDWEVFRLNTLNKDRRL